MNASIRMSVFGLAASAAMEPVASGAILPESFTLPPSSALAQVLNAVLLAFEELWPSGIEYGVC